MIASEIEVPVSFCEIFAFYVLPLSTTERVSEISKTLEKGGAVERPIVRPMQGGKFQVLQGWDIVNEFQHRGIERIKVLYGDYTDQDAIHLSIIEQAKRLNLSWICVARALYKVKNSLSLTDVQLAAATKGALDRTTVSRFIKISKALSPRLQYFAETGRISRSTCKQLITLPISKQEEIANDVEKKALSNDQIVLKYFPRKELTKKASTQSSTLTKSNDIKFVENSLSTVLGSPALIVTGSSFQSGGTVELEFFNRPQLIGLVNQILKGLKRGAIPSGSISFNFKDLDDFDRMFGGLITEE